MNDTATAAPEQQGVIETAISATVGEAIEDHVGSAEQPPTMEIVAAPDADGDLFGAEPQEEGTADPSF